MMRPGNGHKMLPSCQATKIRKMLYAIHVLMTNKRWLQYLKPKEKLGYNTSNSMFINETRLRTLLLKKSSI